MTEYNYLPISDSISPPYSSFTNSAINNRGDIALEGFVSPDLPPFGIFIANSFDSEALNRTIVDNSEAFFRDGTFLPVFEPSINELKEVAFVSTEPSLLTDETGNLVFDETNQPIIQLDRTTIKIGDGAQEPVTLVESTEPFNALTGLDLNDRGTILYVQGNLLNVPVDFPVATNIFTLNAEGVTTTIASTDGIFSSFDVGLDTIGGDGPLTSLDISPSINESEQVAFSAGLDAGGQGIFVGDGESITEIANSYGEFDLFSSPDINDEGAIAFLAQRDNGSRGIYLNSYGETELLVDDSEQFSFFNSQPALNNNGEVAFYAELDDGSAGIYVASEIGNELVVSVGDQVDDSTVKDLVIVQDGLNDYGQVAFQAELADGSFAIFRAEPISTPSDGNDRLYGDVGNNYLDGGAGDDLIVGGDGDDTLLGGEGNDILRGGAGNDVLEGGAGHNKLFGGEGHDIFKLASGCGSDLIFDYVDGVDKFSLGAGLQFDHLEILSNNHDTDIKLSATGETLASLVGVDAQAIEATDFV
ncbi:MAG: calcium-binding protein [Pleurocapsa sp.]